MNVALPLSESRKSGQVEKVYALGLRGLLIERKPVLLDIFCQIN